MVCFFIVTFVVLIDPFKQVLDIMLNFEFLEKALVFFLKCLFTMMLLLIQNVVIYVFDLRVAVRKRPIAFLPAEFAFDPGMVINKICRIIFHIPDEVR